MGTVVLRRIVCSPLRILSEDKKRETNKFRQMFVFCMYVLDMQSDHMFLSFFIFYLLVKVLCQII